MSANGSPLGALTDQIERAISAGLYYLAIVVALALPDICAALESPNGEATRQRYKVWCDAWFLPKYHFLTSQDLYSMRCGVLHQGRLGHPNMQYARVLFTLPNADNNVAHHNIIYGALNLDVETFCHDMNSAVDQWYSAKQSDPSVQANLPRLVQFYPQGLDPYIGGLPLIS